MASIDEYKTFLASAPESMQEYRTLELYHSSFSEVIRVVNRFTDQTFTLEDDAPRNPGEAVIFDTLYLKIEEPEESKEDDSLLEVNMGSIGNLVQDQLSMIDGDGYLEEIQLVYRKYYSGDLTDPVKVLYLAVSSVIFESYENVKLTGEDSDLINKNSGTRYILSRFPMLKE